MATNRFDVDTLTGVLPGSLSRRALLRRAAAGGAATTLLGTAHLAGAAEPVPAVPPVADLPPSPEPQTREFVLTASEFDWELMPGTTVRAWGYNGQVPGPELRVREGDLVRITLRNALSVPTTIHWHGVNLPPAMDGPAGLNQAAVDPGAEFVYEFVAKPAGSRWYHSHADPALQVPMGLYGSLVIEPRVPVRTYDREYTLVLGEWDLELTPDVASGKAERGPRDRELRGGELGSDLFLINGHMHGAVPPIQVAEGERVLLRLVHAGHLPHPFHIHGHSFKIVATDGNPIPEAAQWTKDTVLIAPGERYDLELVADNPGVWMVHCHIEHHMANGMMTVIAYDGHKPSGPAADLFSMEHAAPPAASDEHAGHGTTGAKETTPSTANPTSTTAEPQAEAGTGDAVVVKMVDDRFQPREIEVAAGTTVTWVNKGRNWHSIASSDAGFTSPKLGPGESFSFRFEAPAVYRYFCKHHGLQGMAGRVTVT
ncbi:MAG: multicopper oxidase domain-containing protein [Chloroflexota bacterium]|nr:multicopper oxidase domain-containing protein [Chloroflexota bacterium]